MITIYKTESEIKKEGKEYITCELRGLSGNQKPTKSGDKYIDNGSVFIEIDTGKIFFYDLSTQTWKEV